MTSRLSASRTDDREIQRTLIVDVRDTPAGLLEEFTDGSCRFRYLDDYDGPPVSLTMPVEGGSFEFDGAPPFFDGLLPEGERLELLLKRKKIDRSDVVGQLEAIAGWDTIGVVRVRRSL